MDLPTTTTQRPNGSLKLMAMLNHSFLLNVYTECLFFLFLYIPASRFLCLPPATYLPRICHLPTTYLPLTTCCFFPEIPNSNSVIRVGPDKDVFALSMNTLQVIGAIPTPLPETPKRKRLDLNNRSSPKKPATRFAKRAHDIIDMSMSPPPKSND